ncbi:hypothetical protein J5X84_13660 [Streptosporangiaceae bacterium NEAU-GS5]|nr:hypothetical protein [Streptosporangiaceae bacterium NEAU-GS5]
MDHSNHTLLQAGSQTAISDRMRELLARAAQDHVYEQRTQGAVLDEIRQRLEGMEWLLREVRERELGGLGGVLESVSGRIDDFTVRPPGWAEGLAQHVELVRDHVDAVADRVGGVGDRVEHVTSQVTPLGELPSLWADVGTVGESVDEALARLQAVLEAGQATTERMSEFARRLGQLQASMEAAAARFTRLDKAVAELAAQNERLEGGVTALAECVGDTVGSAADRMVAAIDQMQLSMATRLTEVDARLTAIETAQQGVTARVEQSETVVAKTVERRAGEVESLVRGVAARLDRIDGRIETADTCLADVDTRLTGTESQLTAFADRMTVLDAGVSAAEGRLATRLDQVAERLDTVDDQVEAVSQRVGQLPATLEIAELHRTVAGISDLHREVAGVGDLHKQAEADQTTRFDALDVRLAEAAAALTPLLEAVTARPDHGQLAATLDERLDEKLAEAVTPAHSEMTRRLGALEETMLALAEALLRPTRNAKD